MYFGHICPLPSNSRFSPIPYTPNFIFSLAPVLPPRWPPPSPAFKPMSQFVLTDYSWMWDLPWSWDIPGVTPLKKADSPYSNKMPMAFKLWVGLLAQLASSLLGFLLVWSYVGLITQFRIRFQHELGLVWSKDSNHSLSVRWFKPQYNPWSGLFCGSIFNWHPGTQG